MYRIALYHICILFSISAFGQQFLPIDTIDKSTPLYQLEIDAQGNRYYSFEHVSTTFDSVKINNQIYEPRVIGEGLIVVLGEDGDSLYAIRPGANRIQLVGDELSCFLSFQEDSIIVDDVTYINQSTSLSGQNLLVRTYDQQGDLNMIDHWATTANASYYINGSYHKNGSTAVIGWISSDTINLGWCNSNRWISRRCFLRTF